ncbi:uncharacterized protein LOC101740955 [Bombyx mori]|uniref:MICOS complex subunit MIC13 n=1 Tax=Bombyx mori TaxID=7091 RepID=A0A8R1WE44_BOMMO|nr:uncharacterized protein LOC101740955 [Bombyx mori]
MCDNLDPSRVRCDVCRTINLANHVKQTKPNMQIYEKCSPAQKVECPRVTELPLSPTCIKVCSREEYKLRKSGKTITHRVPYYAHGKLLYAVKAGILVGTVYFTYTQGVWGDQQDVTECIKRWQEYIRSINTRRPPTFDQCGKVIRKESTESIVAPIYNIYKSLVTTCFSGVAKLPLVVKCAYIDYLEALEKRKEELEKERKIKKSSQ